MRLSLPAVQLSQRELSFDNLHRFVSRIANLYLIRFGLRQVPFAPIFLEIFGWQH